MSLMILYAFATALLSGLTSTIDSYYTCPITPGKQFGKLSVDISSFQTGEFQREYFFLVLDPDEATSVIDRGL